MFTSISLSFVVIFLAEMGDKSQIACMALAARHRSIPVLLGVSTAFLLLNLLAVTIGASLAQWLPAEIIMSIAILMFALFGIHNLLAKVDEENETLQKSTKSIFITAFTLTFIAELGDKTQLAVAGLSVTELPIGVWVGASLALITTSAIGIFVGKRWVTRISPAKLQKFSGVIFLLLASYGLFQLLV